jgi:DinB superfamily
VDLLAYFLVEHAAVHARDVGGRPSPIERVFALDDAQMRTRPGPGLNSLVWLLWHMARTEDAAVSAVVAARDQVLDEDWIRRMNVPWRIIGTGMTDGEVGEMTVRADVAAVRAYRSAVGRRTREVVSALRPEAWDEIVGVEDIRRGAAAGAFRDWVEGTSYPWLGWTRAEQLASSALRHNAAHVGEAVTIRSLAGLGL